jgi:hypothetical protein
LTCLPDAIARLAHSAIQLDIVGPVVERPGGQAQGDRTGSRRLGVADRVRIAGPIPSID